MRFTFLLLCLGLRLSAQTHQVVIDARQQSSYEPSALPVKGQSPAGNTLTANNRYLLLNGKPWLPVMGEFHYSRYPEAGWEEQLLKMKQNGIAIISTYVLWNAHENPRGVWNWEGNKDVKKFIALCAKNQLYVWLRIGPYCNAEQIYGGLPAWVQSMKGKRSNDSAYLQASQTLYEQVGQQTRGLYFKDGGPVIGVQLENEYASGSADHIATLREMAIKEKILPVFYSVTANTVFHGERLDILPLQGAYPYRGWEKNGGGASLDFLYGNDQWIMTDALGKLFYDPEKFPRGMCEQGCGSQVTYKNRFIVDPAVVAAHAQNQIGRGMNLLGYYMFQGGTQIPGLRDRSCPESYDFQAPLGEYGLPRTSYYQLNPLHQWLHDFGEQLAPMEVLPAAHPLRNPYNTDSIRFSTRLNGNSGYVFLCNTQVRVAMPDKTIQLRIQLPAETIQFPEVTLAGGTAPILPFNLTVNGITLKYATAQVFARMGRTLFLTRVKGMTPELRLVAGSIRKLDAPGWESKLEEQAYTLRPGKGNIIHITGADGQQSSVVLLTEEEAAHASRIGSPGKEGLLITNAVATSTPQSLVLQQLHLPEINFKIYGGPANLKMGNKTLTGKADGIFRQYHVTLAAKDIKVPIQQGPGGTMKVRLPDALPAGVSDVFLDVDYSGSGITGSIGQQVAADDLYTGLHWWPGLKRFAGKGDMILQVQSWNNNITGVSPPTNLHDGIHQVKVVPEYKVELNY